MRSTAARAPCIRCLPGAAGSAPKQRRKPLDILLACSRCTTLHRLIDEMATHKLAEDDAETGGLTLPPLSRSAAQSSGS